MALSWGRNSFSFFHDCRLFICNVAYIVGFFFRLSFSLKKKMGVIWEEGFLGFYFLLFCRFSFFVYFPAIFFLWAFVDVDFMGFRSLGPFETTIYAGGAETAWI